MKNENKILISVEEISKSFGIVPVLRNVRFSLCASDSLAILGPSGSGKSTLLKILAGIETSDHGRVIIDSKLASEGPKIFLYPHARGISMVFQDLGLWPNLSVFDNVMLGLHQHRNLPKSVKSDRVSDTLQKLGISELFNRKPWQISGGEQQRVALARAFISEPKILLLDEPFTGLDLITKRVLFGEIVKLCRSDTILIMVTHDLVESQMLCRKVMTIEAGQIKDKGKWSDVLKAPKSEILKSYGDFFNIS